MADDSMFDASPGDLIDDAENELSFSDDSVIQHMHVARAQTPEARVSALKQFKEASQFTEEEVEESFHFAAPVACPRLQQTSVSSVGHESQIDRLCEQTRPNSLAATYCPGATGTSLDSLFSRNTLQRNTLPVASDIAHQNEPPVTEHTHPTSSHRIVQVGNDRPVSEKLRGHRANSPDSAQHAAVNTSLAFNDSRGVPEQHRSSPPTADEVAEDSDPDDIDTCNVVIQHEKSQEPARVLMPPPALPHVRLPSAIRPQSRTDCSGTFGSSQLVIEVAQSAQEQVDLTMGEAESVDEETPSSPHVTGMPIISAASVTDSIHEAAQNDDERCHAQSIMERSLDTISAAFSDMEDVSKKKIRKLSKKLDAVSAASLNSEAESKKKIEGLNEELSNIKQKCTQLWTRLQSADQDRIVQQATMQDQQTKLLHFAEKFGKLQEAVPILEAGLVSIKEQASVQHATLGALRTDAQILAGDEQTREALVHNLKEQSQSSVILTYQLLGHLKVADQITNSYRQQAEDLFEALSQKDGELIAALSTLQELQQDSKSSEASLDDIEGTMQEQHEELLDLLRELTTQGGLRQSIDKVSKGFLESIREGRNGIRQNSEAIESATCKILKELDDARLDTAAVPEQLQAMLTIVVDSHLSTVVNSLSTQLDNATERLVESTTLRDEISTLNTLLRNAEATLERASRDKDELMHRHSMLQHTCKLLEDQSASNALDGASGPELLTLNRQLGEAHGELKHTKDLLQTQEQKTSLAEEKRDAAVAANAKSAAQVTILEASYRDLECKLRTSEVEHCEAIATLQVDKRSKLDAADQACASLQDALTELTEITTADRHKLQGRIDELEASTDQLSTERTNAQQQYAGRQEEITNLTTRLTKELEEKEQLREALHQLRAHFESTLRQLADEEGKYNALHDNHTEVVRKVSQYEQDMRAMDLDLEARAKDATDFENEAKHWKDKHSKLHEEMIFKDNIIKNLGIDSQQQADTIDVLKAKLHQQSAHIQATEAHVKELQTSQQGRERLILCLQQQSEELASELAREEQIMAPTTVTQPVHSVSIRPSQVAETMLDPDKFNDIIDFLPEHSQFVDVPTSQVTKQVQSVAPQDLVLDRVIHDSQPHDESGTNAGNVVELSQSLDAHSLPTDVTTSGTNRRSAMPKLKLLPTYGSLSHVHAAPPADQAVTAEMTHTPATAGKAMVPPPGTLESTSHTSKPPSTPIFGSLAMLERMITPRMAQSEPGVQTSDHLLASKHKHTAAANISSKLEAKPCSQAAPSQCSMSASADNIPPMTPSDKAMQPSLIRGTQRQHDAFEQHSSDPAVPDNTMITHFKITKGTLVRKETQRQVSTPRGAWANPGAHPASVTTSKETVTHVTKSKKRKYDDRFDQELSVKRR